MEALAEMALSQSDRRFRNPGSGNRSFLYRFGELLLGAVAISSDESDFVPGGRYSVRLEFGADSEARELVREGDTFTVWYGGDIGTGRITSIL
jgi:hypothetical protein